MDHHQAGQIRIYAATERCSDNQRAQVICCRLHMTDPIAKDRSCDIMKFTVKEKVNLSFDITANASTTSFFY